MKRLRPTYFLFATALVLAVLQQSGNVAAAGPRAGAVAAQRKLRQPLFRDDDWWITCAICGNRHFRFRWSWQAERS